jgi:hypothetical protein
MRYNPFLSKCVLFVGGLFWSKQNIKHNGLFCLAFTDQARVKLVRTFAKALRWVSAQAAWRDVNFRIKHIINT